MDTNIIPSLTEDQCWRAVLDRDSNGDGRFVYAVRSTGIFCRPSCPSRRAGREQVTFYALAEAAARAGYRPCKRCRPERTEVVHPHSATVQAVCRSIENHEEGVQTLAHLGAETGLSPSHLQRLFKSLMGISPRQYAEAVRLERLKRGIKDGEPVASALYGAGYGSSSRLYEKAPVRLGMTPASFAKGGRGANITYAIVDHAGLGPLGKLLVAATERGICMVALGSADAELERDLHDDYPLAALRRDDASLSEWVSAIVDLAEGHPPHADLPLDIRATAFQCRVFEQLSAIPCGKTRSYGEIAAALGQPGAARAVGRACATNPVAVVVPCHRAVGASGSMRGYRWGLDRKQALLARERKEQQTR